MNHEQDVYWILLLVVNLVYHIMLHSLRIIMHIMNQVWDNRLIVNNSWSLNNSININHTYHYHHQYALGICLLEYVYLYHEHINAQNYLNVYIKTITIINLPLITSIPFDTLWQTHLIMEGSTIKNCEPRYFNGLFPVRKL